MISADIVIEKLDASSKKQAFHQIAAQAATLMAANEDDIFDALLDRERLGTTGIGCGVAMPHIKTELADRMYGIFARLVTPIDYDAIDNDPVDIIFFLIAPADSKMTLHLKALATVARFLKNEDHCQKLREAAGSEHIAGILNRWVEENAA